MNKFNRVIFSIAGICLVIGVIILIVVSATGGWGFLRNGQHNNNWNWNWNNGSHSNNSKYGYQDYDMDFDGDIKSLDITIPYAEVTIKQGDSFSLAVSHAVSNSFDDTKVENGVLKIIQKYDDDFWGDTGFHIGKITNHNSPKVTITVPEDFTAEDFKLDFDAGVVDISDIKTEYTSLELGAGDFSVTNLTADKIDISGGVGQLEMKDVNLNDLSLKTGVGEASVQGVVTGDCDISAGIGEVDFDLDGNEDDYYVDIDSGVGDVRFNGRNISSTVGDRSAKNVLDIDTGIGEIDITID